MLYDSDLYVSSSGGKISVVKLATNFKLTLSNHTKEDLLSCIRLRKYSTAFELCKLLGDNEHWMQLGASLILDLDVTFGNKIYSNCNKKKTIFNYLKIIKQLKCIEKVEMLQW